MITILFVFKGPSCLCLFNLRWCHDLIELTMSCHNFASFSSSTELLEAGFEAHYHHHKHESWGVTPYDGLKLHPPGAGIHPPSRMDLTTFPLFLSKGNNLILRKIILMAWFWTKIFFFCKLTFYQPRSGMVKGRCGLALFFFFIRRLSHWSVLASYLPCVLGY